jgi:uncharacterized protein (DUF362 family)
VTRHHVILRHCDSYDSERIRTIVREGMEELNLRPRGRTLVKPNLVIAHEMFAHAYTRPEFMDGVLGALRDREEPGELEELAVGERCGITMPTRMAFSEAGYAPVLRKHRARRYLFDEVTQVQIPLRHPDRLRDYVFTPEPVARADFFVNCPKFKAHPWTTVTFGLKNFIGIQDDRHRMIDHDWALNDKIADLQEIVAPQLIAIDAITAGQGRMLTPTPFPLNLVIMGDNQVAIDATCCRLLGVDPLSVDHIAISARRGVGSLAVEDIQVTGDVTPEAARERAEDFQVGLVRVEKYFEGTKLKAYAGPPPAEEKTDYCWGGCPGAVEESIEIIRQMDETMDERIKPMHVVFGAYDGPLDVKKGERVIFMGDCAKWKGEICGKPVDIESTYVERDRKDPHHAKMQDIYLKMAAVVGNVIRRRKEDVVRVQGCPVSVAEQTLYLAILGGVKNPYLDPRTVVPFMSSWIAWRFTKVVRWLMRIPYQKDLPADQRGDAAPHYVLPAN